MPQLSTTIPTWTSDPREARPIAYGEEFPANQPSQTVVEILNDTVLRMPHRVSHRFTEEGESKEVTWLQYHTDVCQFAKACIATGADPHTGVAIQGSNSYPWVVALVGAMFARCVPAGVYPTNGPADSQHVANLARSHVVVVESEKELENYFEEGKSMLTSSKCFVVWNQFSDKWRHTQVPVYSWKEFMEFGKRVSNQEMDERLQSLHPGHAAAIIPTSGTTGRAKGVMLSHDNITYMTRSLTRALEIGDKDRVLSYLPLSHIAGQMLDCYGPLMTGYPVTFVPSQDVKNKLPDYVKAVKPTLFFGTPRIFEKIQEAIERRNRRGKWIQRKVFSWARNKALEAHQRRLEGNSEPAFYGLAKSLLNRIKKMIGLDQARIVATGAAPIRAETLSFWTSLDFDLLNTYGMSESSGIQTTNLPGLNRLGTAGTPLPGTEVKLLESDDRGQTEIACKGRHVFLGYLDNPTATEETFTPDGFLKSGDYGQMDAEGYLQITGRKKELLVTSAGENVAPLPIEERLREALPFVSQAVVIGDKRHYLTGLLTLKCRLDDEMRPTQELSEDAKAWLGKLGCQATTTVEAAQDKRLIQHLKEICAQVNAQATSNAQKVQKLAVLPEDFSIEVGTLTPTLKLRRQEIVKRYASEIEALYRA